MRSSVAKFAWALQQRVAGHTTTGEVLPAVQAVLIAPHHVRCMAGGGSHGPVPETPLTKIMPPIVALPRQVISTALSLTGKLIVGAATSGPVKNAVNSFADDVLLKEKFVKLSELDVSYWAYWLATAGYTSQSGYRRLAEAAVEAVPHMSAQQITDLVVGFHIAHYHDKALLSAVSFNISANFTKFETEQLLQVLSAFNDMGHYSGEVYDDIADSITYANHYLAPVKAPVTQVIKAMTTYAKFNHERADLFITLARGISEAALSKLPAAERHDAVVSGLRALKRFDFYPEQVDALLYFTEAEADAFSTEDLSLAKSVKDAVEAEAGGKLAVYRQNDSEDADHWYAHHAHHAPAQYELYAFRSALVPKAYSPAAFRPANK